MRDHRGALVDEEQSDAGTACEDRRGQQQTRGRGQKRHADEQEEKGRVHESRSSPVSGLRFWSSSWPSTARASMKMVTARVITMAVRTNACGSGSAASDRSPRPARGSPLQAPTPAESRMKFAACEMRVSPKTPLTIERCIMR